MEVFVFYTFVLLAVGPFIVVAQKEEPPTSFEMEMIRNLTRWEKYKSHIPPDNGDEEDGQIIQFQPWLELIEELDEKKQQLTTLMAIRMKWKDMRLTWDPSDYGGVTRLVTNEDRVWKPDIILANKVIEIWDHQRPALILVNDGNVMRYFQKRYQTTCPLDFRKFPFDEQKCDFWFMERNIMSRYKTQMNLTLWPTSRLPTLPPGMTHHPVWEIIDHKAKSFEHTHGNQTNQYLRYTYNLKRRGYYYSYMFITPAVMLALLIPVLFLMPTEGTVRFTLGGALLISICILLLMLEDELPITHTSIPAIGLFYTVTFVLVTLSLVLGTLTHNISTKSLRLSHPPYILKKILLSCVARLFCVPYDSKYGVGTTDVGLGEAGKQGSEETDPQTEWKLMAMVLDRILFLIFLIIVIITSFALLA